MQGSDNLINPATAVHDLDSDASARTQVSEDCIKPLRHFTPSPEHKSIGL